ncbi:antiholin-like protein LrgB [Vagococcus silagei]|uniref:Antiholin-like protein LrgB n=1 Tax=Vagococcus silagei TaxID=2508885 RepID=A0A4V3TV35_9ENTE|nr:antiholin-like protein LrgB [Vagococcus silagei]THB61239.1 antiholin-like protein LrgB [Vagococcus silagei]
MTPYVGIIISLVSFGIGTYLFKKTNKFFLFTPLFVAMILGVLILKVTGISYEDYNQGGKVISFFLEPATIAFAIPLYKKRDILKKYWLEITSAIVIGSLVSVISIIAVGRVIAMDGKMISSLLPQAATTAIAIPVAESIGGIASLTAFSVIFNAVIVFALGQAALKLFHINDPISKGLALGASGHALGVAVAMDMGETETAMASISVVIIGVIVVVVVPLAHAFLGIM